MKWALKNETGEIIGIAPKKLLDSMVEIDEDYDVGFDGKLYSETELQSDDYLARRNAFDNSIALIELRNQREEECFSVINRGALWYDKLTDEQKEELSSWYEEWLNAPETGIIPSKPTWIDSVTKRRPS